MSTPKKGFTPIRDRAFFLSDITIQRLGGPVAAEIMRMLVVEKRGESDIIEKLGITAAEYLTHTSLQFFMRELKAQRTLRKHDEQFKKHGRIQDLPPMDGGWPTKLGTGSGAAPTELPSLYNVQLPAGVSPQEWALRRINQVTPQAVETLVALMHNARQESVRYNAAAKLLGLNGIVEIEKSIHVIADAEAIIRELNKRGPYKKEPKDITDAELMDGVGMVSGDSEPAPIQPIEKEPDVVLASTDQPSA